ncbi:MAG: sigma-54 dependent transcriptional regulator [Marinilabiliaceae bacterium]|jgi:DNA-binding NtrC family response regulator|nr:sigma-54 dependent transcriptional regulator [Marinilabiliaceae bacterium]
MKKEGKILVVDDSTSILESCQQLLKHDFEKVDTISNPGRIPEKIGGTDYDVILLDMNFSASVSSGNEGLFWLREILASDPGAVVIMITAYGDIDLAVRSVKEGAAYFIQKPWEPARLIATIQSGMKFRKANIEVRNLKRRNQLLNSGGAASGPVIMGSSPALKKCLDMVSKVAATDANVLLSGENGTGKELFAREIHRLSGRRQEVFISVDMGTVSASLFESELFGHRKGAFTDAKDDRTGRIELADMGTLFLDEIGNLPVSLQAKILTMLEQRQITPVGSNNPVDVDLRLISATNMNLQDMVGDKLFREDLLYRLNTIEIRVPPLRDRGEDIALLTDYFLQKFSRHYNKNGIKIDANAYSELISYHWPGNVRELKHAVERAVILADSHILKPADFFNPSSKDQGFISQAVRPLALVEKELISAALEKNEMNISRAARDLDISRSTLYSKIKRYGL